MPLENLLMRRVVARKRGAPRRDAALFHGAGTPDAAEAIALRCRC